jgi:CheY-like chemotaxis protein
VTLLGGKIKVKSAIGIGSTFSFVIPLNYDEQEHLIITEQHKDKPSHTGQKTILIAEDDDINFLLIERILTLRDYRILRATNGLEAINMLNDHVETDLIFMDIKMPVMDGFEALKEIKKFNISIPIIANTAYSSSEDKEQIKNAGFTSYISKPLNKLQVFEVIDGIFGMN